MYGCVIPQRGIENYYVAIPAHRVLSVEYYKYYKVKDAEVRQ